MNLPSQDQINSALRSIGITAGTIGSIAALAGVMSADQAAAFAADMQALVKDLTATFSDFSKLVLLLMPIITVYLARLGIKAASPASQRASVATQQPHTLVVQMDDHDTAISTANLVAAIPGVKQIVSSPAVADASLNSKIVAPADAKEVPK
jgi:hypothetical protein